jgi:hypothetical protein
MFFIMIHKGLVALKEGKYWIRSWWYYVLMHMFLYKGFGFFGNMTLNRNEDETNLPILAWTRIFDVHDQESRFFLFENIFSSNMRIYLSMNVPIIPIVFHYLLREKERRPNVTTENHWGHMILYANCPILKFYGTSVTPHIILRAVLFKVGFLEVIWKLVVVEENHLLNKKKGTFFLAYILF